MKAITGLFGGGAPKAAAPQPQGPSEAQLRAQELAEKQQADLEARRAEEEAAKDAQLRLLRGLQGRGGSQTLFGDTGTRGLSSTLG